MLIDEGRSIVAIKTSPSTRARRDKRRIAFHLPHLPMLGDAAEQATTGGLEGDVGVVTGGDSAVDDGLLLLVQQRNQLPLGADARIAANKPCDVTQTGETAKNQNPAKLNVLLGSAGGFVLLRDQKITDQGSNLSSQSLAKRHFLKTVAHQVAHSTLIPICSPSSPLGRN